MRVFLLILICLSSGGVLAQGAEDSREWRKTLETISTGVVSIRVDGTRAFDTEWNQSTQATGFVVDAERGLILTNRHVVMPGPVVAEGVFLNREEVELLPVYRDPVHDFGLFRYDPQSLRYITPHEFVLNPEGAQIGRDIRVVGNDAGEQLSILAGTIARLDRHAPGYGKNKYNDFNTFYIQAASGTSGGSSGSPVIDIEGRVIALNAGGNQNAQSSFFLPLDRIERALRLIQHGEPVSRGTLQTVFRHRPYDELRRLGLRPETEERVRASSSELTGMLVVAEVVPGGPTDGVLDPGDILVSVNGELVTAFVPLETLLDANVGETLTLEIERGDAQFTREVVVGDLHALTPNEFMEFSSAIVHDLSYQQARHFNKPVEGIFVASPGYAFSVGAVPRGAVITELNGEPMRTLDDLEAALEGLADGDPMTVRYYSYDDPHRGTLRVLRMDRRWFPARRCLRDDEAGFWPCRAIAAGPPPGQPTPGSTRFIANGDRRARALARSLVMVNFDMPYTISGVSERHYYGTGVIVDTDKGLVVVDRNTVPVAMGDVRITFAGSLEVPGRVEYVHPLHNLAVVSYDPALILDTPVKAVQFNTRPVEPGTELWVVGLKADQKLVAQATEVASVDAVQFPLTRSFRFRDSNLETISVVNAPANVDGVLADSNGRVVSLWSSFAFQRGRELEQTNMGLPAELVEELVSSVRSGGNLHSLEAELLPVPLSAARKLGLPDSEVRLMEAHDRNRRVVLKIMRLVAGSPASDVLQTGDLLLRIDGELVNTFREVERSVQKPAVNLAVWRGDEMVELKVGTVELGGGGIDRVLMWAGALIQEPHRELAAQRDIAPVGVYIAYFGYGSPATRHGLWAGRRIVEVDGESIPDMDAFIDAVIGREDRSSVRVKTVQWNNAVDVITLKLDQTYWPAYELRRTSEGWTRFDLEPQARGAPVVSTD